jgi:hypothetical protein
VVRADNALWSTERALSGPLVVGLGEATCSVSAEVVEILIGS